MIVLYDTQTNVELGVISPTQFEFLSSKLEEESATDQDYYINQVTVDMFEAEGADPALVALLRQALGSREEMEIRWEER